MEHVTPAPANASESPSPSPSVRTDGGHDRERGLLDELRRALRAFPAPASVRLRTEPDDERSGESLESESDRSPPYPPVEEASDADVRRAIESVE